MKSCQEADDAVTWFSAAVNGDLAYITSNIARYKMYRDRRTEGPLVQAGFAAIHYAILNREQDVFIFLLEHEYLALTKTIYVHTLSNSKNKVKKFKLGVNSSIVHLSILMDNVPVMRHIIQHMQCSNDKELISLQNQYGQTASMLGAIIGNESAKLWYESPLVTLIESFIPDIEGTTFLMAAGLYKRAWMFKELAKLFACPTVGDLYKRRIIKLTRATTAEGWNIDDAITDQIENHEQGYTDDDILDCQSRLMQLKRAINEYEKSNPTLSKSTSRSRNGTASIANIPIEMNDEGLLGRNNTIILLPDVNE